MIHGGLNINIKGDLFVQHCCLRKDYVPISPGQPIWQNSSFAPLREKNLQNQWDPGCANCEQLEKVGLASFRQGMNQGLEIYGKQSLSGPARIDIMFDISCNLACRICGPHSSTFWQKHLKKYNEWANPIFSPRSKTEIIQLLSGLNLENLRQVVFCGGETLIGNEYWEVAKWLAENVPNAKQQLTVCFQTNGTQPIHPKNFDTIEKLHLIKLHVSLDGVGAQFEYMRWPASWNQVQENLLELKQTVPSNVMFLIEETISIFNILNIDQVDQWVAHNFATNREGDVTVCTKHLAAGTFSPNNVTTELVQMLEKNSTRNLIPTTWVERPQTITAMIAEIKKFDLRRNQSFQKTFPETAAAYARYW
jgi:sulfatase maturation enzyme AslB (radical SAM superfamily)